MYCVYCGKEIPNDGDFCPYCGKSNKTGFQREDLPIDNRLGDELKTKRFYFGTFETNDSSINKINEWLLRRQIVISSISFITHLNAMWTRTVLGQCEINYRDYTDNPYVYQVNYFCDWHWISQNHSKLDQELYDWEMNHPDCKVVYYTHTGHEYSGGNTMTLYFLYTVARGSVIASQDENIRIYDDCGWLKNKTAINRQIYTTHDNTGLWPLLIVKGMEDQEFVELTEGDIESYLKQIYDSEFNNERQIILLFLVSESGEYKYYIYTGNESTGMIDSPDITVLIETVKAGLEQYD